MWEALQSGGIVMVCGTSDKMPDAVRAAFVQVAQQVGGLSEGGADEFVRGLERSGRYLVDTWS